jgi:hypothetical protein
MKNFYIAVQIQENEKYYAYIVSCTDSDNLLSKLKIRGIVSANICQTKKAARAIVEAWNEAFRYTGIYLFDTMPDGSPAPF